MSPSSKSKDFSKLFQSSEKELYTEKFYEAMEMNPEDLHNYDEKCNNLVVTESRDQMKQICKKYLRFLYTSKTWRGQFTGLDISLLLSYWVYENLIKIYVHRNSKQIDLGFSDLQIAWAKFFNYKDLEKPHIKNCKPELDEVNHEDWQNRKKLYEYYVDFDNLFGKASTYYTICKEYYDNIKELSTVYKYFEVKCLSSGDDCPEIFGEFKKKNPVHMLENLSCYQQIDKQKKIDQAEDSNDLSGPKVGTLEDRGTSGLQDGAEDNQNPESTSQSSDIQSKVANSVLGAAPVLFTATMLYRYTPLGPWIRRLGGGRINNMNALDTLSPYTQETGDMFSNDSENYISYQPI